MITDPFAVLAVLAIVVYVAVRLEQHIKVFRWLGSALVGILCGMILSNLGVLPGTSPTYDFLVGPSLDVGIALILLQVDVRSVLRAGPSMLAAFAIGATGTAIGALVGGVTLASSVGPETWKLAGQYTGTYTGGGMNFAALGRALGTSSDLFSAAVAADVLVTAIWMMTCLAVPVILGRVPQEQDTSAGAKADEGKPFTLERALHSSGRPMALADAAALVGIALSAVWLAGAIAAFTPQIPSVLWLTSIALVAAQVPQIRTLAGGAMWGNYLLLLFLASNGAQSVVANIAAFGMPVLYFAFAVVAIHGIILFGVGRLVRIDMATLAVASQANVGGPASAMALAGARGYADRILPGVAIGLLGYAVGNYSGIAVARIVNMIVGQG